MVPKRLRTAVLDAKSHITISYRLAVHNNKNDLQDLTHCQSYRQRHAQHSLGERKCACAEVTIIVGGPVPPYPPKNFAKFHSNIRNFSPFSNHY